MPQSRLLFFILLLLVLSNCSTNKKDTDTGILIQGKYVTFPDTAITHDLDGRTLAIAYCQSCHLYPEPELLPKSIWQKSVLPNMGMRLGINVTTNLYANLSSQEIQHIIRENVYQLSPVITERDWAKIVKFYVDNAPEKPLPQDANQQLIDSLPFFSIRIPEHNPSLPPLTTVLSYDSIRKSIYVGDRRSNLYTYNHKLELSDSIKLSSPPSDIMITDKQIYLLTMGLMDPTDEYSGELQVKTADEQKFQKLLSHLPRPVHLNRAAIVTDNTKEWIISGFGNQTGRLSWFKEGNNKQLTEQVLKPVPGTLKTITYDFDRDGKQDIIALIAQANEQISIFYNKGDGKFEEKIALKFPPVYGSSSFELTDFNNDGAPDILYTNGDNADLSFSLKKYHGVRIFMNDGKNNFEQQWFFPMYGASKAVGRDFDKDGDIDIAAIAFFPDFETKPQESFIYFENKGMFNFQPYTTELAQTGRWFLMDTADIDQDGDDDILLGSFSFAPSPTPKSFQQAWKSGPPFVILSNNKFLPVQPGLL